ncbi:MAG TPA: hypothetical protein VF178_10920 [Gemmatimonadaceae bacterium]
MDADARAWPGVGPGDALRFTGIVGGRDRVGGDAVCARAVPERTYLLIGAGVERPLLTGVLRPRR